MEVFPDFGFCRGIAEKIGGVIGGQQARAAIFEPFATEAGDAAIGVEQHLSGGGAEADDYFGADGVELADQEWRAGGDFVALGEAIFGRAAFDYVADVDVFALQAHGFDHLRKKLARAADERKALNVFVVAGAFADEDQLGFGIAIAEDDFIALLVEFAARAFTQIGADFFESVVFDAVGGFEKSGAGGDGK